MNLDLLIVVAGDSKREQLTRAFAGETDIAIVGVGVDLNEAYLSTPKARFANLVVVDLTQPESADSRSWVALHVMYPVARIMALTEQPLNETALQAALHAGVYCFASWTDADERLREAACTVCEGKRFYSAQWLIVAAQKLIKDLDVGMVQVNVVRLTPTEQDASLILPPHRFSQLEINLLTYLIRHGERVVSGDELLREVWKCDPEKGGTKNQLKSAFKRLRRKTELASDHHQVSLVFRRHGYCLVAPEAWKQALYSARLALLPIADTLTGGDRLRHR